MGSFEKNEDDYTSMMVDIVIVVYRFLLITDAFNGVWSAVGTLSSELKLVEV
jgi:hypothetical protein